MSSDPNHIHQPAATVRPGILGVSLVILMLAVAITSAAIWRSYFDGRLSQPITHNDVNYFMEGIQRYGSFVRDGALAEILYFLRYPPHAPMSTYQAAAAFGFLGLHDWAPYASNIIFVIITLGFAAFLLRHTAPIAGLLILVGISGIPLISTSVSEFAPEIPASLFLAMAVICILHSSWDRIFDRYKLAAVFFIFLSFIGKPTAFVFDIIAVVATVGLTLVTEFFTRRDRTVWLVKTYRGAAFVIASMILPAFYIIPSIEHYWTYFYYNLFDEERRQIWTSPLSLEVNLRFYLDGQAGQYMFGPFLWLYACIIILGLILSIYMNRNKDTLLIIQSILISIFIYLPPFLSPVKNTLFATGFGFLIVFILVLSLRTIASTLRPSIGLPVVGVISVCLLFGGGTIRAVPNLELRYGSAPMEAIDRFTRVIEGNADPRDYLTVYMPNIGTYAQNILQYYMLKRNPYLSGRFTSHWTTTDPEMHFSFISDETIQFVIVGEPGNGFTQLNLSWVVETPVMEFLRDSSEYMVLDSFYGPEGKPIVIFQRQTEFAGFRPVSGMTPVSAAGTRMNVGQTSYLTAYSSISTQGRLELQCTEAVGQTLSVSVNQMLVRTLDVDREGCRLYIPIELREGVNDIVIDYSMNEAVLLSRLVVSRQSPGSPD